MTGSAYCDPRDLKLKARGTGFNRGIGFNRKASPKKLSVSETVVQVSNVRYLSLGFRSRLDPRRLR